MIDASGVDWAKVVFHCFVETEAALRRSEAMLSHVFATSPDCLTLTELETGRYTLTLTQTALPSPGQPDKQPLVIPLRYVLFDAQGAVVDQVPEADAVVRDGLVELTQARHVLRWRGLKDKPLPAFNQGFGAPVKLRKRGSSPCAMRSALRSSWRA